MTCLRKIQKTLIRIGDASLVGFLAILFTWSFWAYVYKLCVNLIKQGNKLQGFLYMSFYVPIFILCIWSYWKVCRTLPGYTSDYYDREEDSVGLLSLLEDGPKRFCQRCNLVKFDRAHHCRQCGKCVLKMDHHCPWINNCVGFHNYKSFYLFILYASLYCIYVFSTTLPAIIIQVNKPMGLLDLSINCVILAFVSAVFGLFFLVPFTCFHTNQICKNKTTIENYEEEHSNPWNIGTKKNIQQVFGKGPFWQQLLPIGKPVGDGTSFPIHSLAISP